MMFVAQAQLILLKTSWKYTTGNKNNHSDVHGVYHFDYKSDAVESLTWQMLLLKWSEQYSKI